MNFSDWSYLYNWDGSQNVRANLVYTPYISPDSKTLCMSFNRDKNYHSFIRENELWTEELLYERFLREMKFHGVAYTNNITTIKIIDIDEIKRHIFIEWHGADFYTQGFGVLQNWKEQWLLRIEQMWDAGIFKFSLHPNSWVVHDETLIPFNWFFCFDKNESIIIKDFLIQISSERQEKMEEFLKHLKLDFFLSFKSNYPNELIADIVKKHEILRQNN